MPGQLDQSLGFANKNKFIYFPLYLLLFQYKHKWDVNISIMISINEKFIIFLSIIIITKISLGLNQDLIEVKSISNTQIKIKIWQLA